MKSGIEIQAYRVTDFCAAFGISRAKMYREISAGRLKSFKVGALTLISKEAANEWLNFHQSASGVEEERRAR